MLCNDAIPAKDAFVASRRDCKLIVTGSFRDLLLHYMVILCARIFKTKVSTRLFVRLSNETTVADRNANVIDSTIPLDIH